MTLFLVILAIGLVILFAISALRDTYNPFPGAVSLAVLRPVCMGVILLIILTAATDRQEPGQRVFILGEKKVFGDPLAGRVLWRTGANAIKTGFDVVALSFASHPFDDEGLGQPSTFHGRPVLTSTSLSSALLKTAWEDTGANSGDPRVFLFSSDRPFPAAGREEDRQAIRWIPVPLMERENTLSLKIPTHWFTESDLEIEVNHSAWADSGLLELEADGQLIETRPLATANAAEREQTSFIYRGKDAGSHTLRLRVRSPEGQTVDETGAMLTLTEKPDIVYVTMQASAPPLLNTLAKKGFNVRQKYFTSLLSGRENPINDMRRGDILVLDAPSPGYLGPSLLRKLDDALSRKGIALLFLPYGGSEKTGLTALQNLLPVYPGPPPRSEEDNTLALVTIVDTSFSMFDPQVKGGVRKIEMAKRALLNLSAAMRDEDRLGIMGTDLRPYWITDLKAPRNPRQEAGKISGMTAIGPGINFYSSLLAASEELDQVTADIRHILVLLDTADVDEYTVLGTGTVWDLLQSFHEKGITVSLVGFGGSGDEHVPSLNEFAEKSGGFLYLASNIEEIPGFFIQDLEQVMDRSIDIRSMKTFFSTGDFPSLKETPSVDGQVIMTLKPGAKRLFWTERGLPLLALWKKGEGTGAVLGIDSGRILSGTWSAAESAPLWDLIIPKLVPETETAPMVYYQRTGSSFEIRYRSSLLPSGSSVTGFWHRREGDSLTVHFMETAPGEHTALLPPGGQGEGYIEIMGNGADGTTEGATLELPAIKDSDRPPLSQEVTFERPVPAPDPLRPLREPILWKLLFILAILLVTMDELLRPPAPEGE